MSSPAPPPLAPVDASAAAAGTSRSSESSSEAAYEPPGESFFDVRGRFGRRRHAKPPSDHSGETDLSLPGFALDGKGRPSPRPVGEASLRCVPAVDAGRQVHLPSLERTREGHDMHVGRTRPTPATCSSLVGRCDISSDLENLVAHVTEVFCVDRVCFMA